MEERNGGEGRRGGWVDRGMEGRREEGLERWREN